MSAVLTRAGSGQGAQDTRAGAWTDVAWLMLAAALVRLLVFSVTANEAGDPDARAIDGALMYGSPHLIYSGIWLPLHPYAVALFMIPFKDPVLAGKILSLVAGVAAMIPFYLLTRLHFDRRTAVLAGGMFAIFGNHVGLSSVVMSETPFVALSLCGILLFAREMSSASPRLRGFCLAALLLALAGGFRQEAWQLSGILMLWMLLDARVRQFVIPYAVVAFSPYVYWTIGNMIDGQGPLFGLLGVAGAKEAERAYIQQSSLMNVVKWAWIFVQSPGPLISLLGLVGLVQAFVRRRWPWALAVIALLMLAPYVLLSIVKSEWAPQHRYVVLPATLLLPYAAAALWMLLPSRRLTAVAVTALFAVSLGTQAIAYGRHSSLYLPVKDYQPADKEIWRWLDANLSPLDRLVVEDNQWRAPGILLHSGTYTQPHETILGNPPADRMAEAVRRIDATVVVIHSPLSRWPSLEAARHEVLFRNDGYVVLRLQPAP